MTYLPEAPVVLEFADWAEFVATTQTKKQLQINYREFSNRYDIRCADAVPYRVVILKGTADATDFETNYKSTANEKAVLPIVETGFEFSAVSLGGVSPSSAGVVALDPVGGLAELRSLIVEATLSGTDGTDLGGDLETWVQCSLAGTAWTDWLRMPDVKDGDPAISYRRAVPLQTDWVTVGKQLSPVATDSPGGLPGEYARVVFSAGAGTTHGISQEINLIGIKPK